jgi:hypothetical protein
VPSDSEGIVLGFIASVKIIYQTPPVAGLRGKAITTAQRNLAELQHRQDFHELMQATPDFAIEIAAKGLAQSLWCASCSEYVYFGPVIPSVDERAKCKNIRDWIDYEKPQDWKAFMCRSCKQEGTCLRVRPDIDTANDWPHAPDGPW